ncbi:MAG: GNAT family N-acetyltransferase [Anaerolineae bacterium]|nr:GNAT family N-acetyltransferase [Anaerolineae bacterium]MDK1081853.1 GNAT family N-acetyltransferase [Anaerolineae bacterium]MDK1118831.1 GNAT family N-acetyltransferase [Anaerolineae bacterium]
MKSENVDVIHNKNANRFEITIDGHVAVLDYLLMDQTITFTHTGVPPAIENRGLGSKLVKTGLDYAKEKGQNVKSMCWFVSKYIRRHPEYQDLLSQS